MNKADIINALSVTYGLSQKEATARLDQVLNVIVRSIPKHGTVKLRGFGTFDVVERQAKTSTNPKTRLPMFIPKRKVVTFIPSDWLQEAVRNSGDMHE